MVNWVEVQDFGDIHNLYSAVEFAAGDRFERFDVTENHDCKIYQMVYELDGRWFVVVFRRVKMFPRFEVDNIEIKSGKWVDTPESAAIKTKLLEFLRKDK